MAEPDHDHSQPQHDILTVLLSPKRRQRLLFFALVTFTLLFFLLTKNSLFESRMSHPIATQNGTLEPRPPFEVETEPVVFSLIMWSEDSAAEGALLLKVGFHFVSGPLSLSRRVTLRRPS